VCFLSPAECSSSALSYVIVAAEWLARRADRSTTPAEQSTMLHPCSAPPADRSIALFERSFALYAELYPDQETG